MFLLLCVFLSRYSISLRCSVYCFRKCVLYFCHRVSTQLLLTNILFHIASNNFNSPVLTYKVNSLMTEVLATTETCLNMDWLRENYRIIKCMEHIVWNIYTNSLLCPADNFGKFLHFPFSVEQRSNLKVLSASVISSLAVSLSLTQLKSDDCAEELYVLVVMWCLFEDVHPKPLTSFCQATWRHIRDRAPSIVLWQKTCHYACWAAFIIWRHLLNCQKREINRLHFFR